MDHSPDNPMSGEYDRFRRRFRDEVDNTAENQRLNAVSAASAQSDGMPARAWFLEKGTKSRPAWSQIRQRDIAPLE